MTAAKIEPEVTDPLQAERVSHAVYGLIIVTATLVAEMDHVDEALHALGLVLGTGLVLLLAHTYSALAAERIVQARRLSVAGRKMVVWSNLPVLLAIIVPALLFSLAWFEFVSLQTAYITSIGFSLLALFGLGVYIGRIASMNWALSLLAGATSGAIGVLVVLVEALFD
ncbi:MAG: hypothetical protein U9N78_01085 [Actinomycetota bacterium]|nr:hypothetical protein [Actinomycetota bacterium]